MATDIATATDAILSTLKVAWDANAQTAAGTSYAPEMIYEGQNTRNLLPASFDGTKAFARAVVRHSTKQLKTALGLAGNQARYRRPGILFVQAFFPLDSNEAWQRSRALARVAQIAYEGRQNSLVSFTSAAVIERGEEGSFYRCDMNMNFYWDEIK